MKTYYIEVEANGRILNAGSCPSTIYAMVAHGELHPPAVARHVVPRQADVRTDRWHRGALVPVPPQPSPYHQFDYVVGQWELDIDLVWAAVRRERDDRLARTDWVVLRAADQGTPVPPEWLAYRQALRDVTDQSDPLNIIWPTPPVA